MKTIDGENPEVKELIERLGTRTDSVHWEADHPEPQSFNSIITVHAVYADLPPLIKVTIGEKFTNLNVRDVVRVPDKHGRPVEWPAPKNGEQFFVTEFSYGSALPELKLRLERRRL